MGVLKVLFVIFILLILVIGIGAGVTFIILQGSLRQNLVDNIYRVESEKCSIQKEVSVSQCEEYVTCYVERTAANVKFLNLRRWGDETKFSENPYYVLRGHLTSEGMSDGSLNQIQVDCASELGIDGLR